MSWLHEPRIYVAEFTGVIPTNYDGTPKAPPAITIFPAAHEHPDVVDHSIADGADFGETEVNEKVPTSEVNGARGGASTPWHAIGNTYVTCLVESGCV